MQNCKDFLDFNEFINMDKTFLTNCSLLKNIHIKSKTYFPELVRIPDVSIPWGKYLEKRKDIVRSINDQISAVSTDNTYFLTNENTNVWSKLYSKTGLNFFNFLFDDCTLILEWKEGHFVNLNRNFNRKHTFKTRKQCHSDNFVRQIVSNNLGYNPKLIICRKKMFYNNIFVNGKQLIINEPNVLEAILRQNVGQNVNYSIKHRLNIRKMGKINSSGLCVEHVRKMLKNSLPPNTTVVTKNEVHTFLKKIISIVVPYKIFNKRKSFNKFLQNLSTIVFANPLYEVTLNEIMKGVITETNVAITNLYAKIIMWIITEVAFNIVRCCFYVAETNKELSYVLLSQWILKEKISLNEMVSDRKLQIVNINDDKGSDRKYISKMRFAPKSSLSSLRPIVHSSLYQKNGEQFAKWCNIFLRQLLVSQCKVNLKVSDNIHENWKNFIEKVDLKAEVYYVRTDVQDAYGSIDHHILKNILNSLIGKINISYLNLISFDCMAHENRVITCQQFSNLPLTLSARFIRKSNKCPMTVNVHSMKKFIFDFIDTVYVKLKNSKKVYHYKKGLPQGLKLSAILCEIYYNHFDNMELKSYYCPEEGDILLRSVDDYLFVSKVKRKAALFLHTMLHSGSKYGFKIQVEKTNTNLFQELSVVEISYFGYVINFKKKTISPDITYCEGKTIKTTFIYKKALDIRGIKRRICNFSAIKLNNFILDNTFLSSSAILVNIFCVSFVMAVRYSIMCTKLTKDEKQSKQIFTTIKHAISHLAIKCSSKNKLLSTKAPFKIRFVTVKYVIIKACIQVLKDKKSHRNSLLKLHGILLNLKKYMTIKERNYLNNTIKKANSNICK